MVLDREYFNGAWIVSGSASALIACYLLDEKRGRINASTFADLKPPIRSDLPVYKVDEIKKHGKEAERKWVMFKEVGDAEKLFGTTFLGCLRYHGLH